jgi:hypothetical protein
MCICGGVEVAAALVIGGVAMKKLKIEMPPLMQLVGKVRAGVKPGQVFKDKRKAARVNERAQTRREMSE